MENVIEVRDVNKFFGEEHVLKNVSHTFATKIDRSANLDK